MKMKRKIRNVKTPTSSNVEVSPKATVKPTSSAVSSVLSNCAPSVEILAAKPPKDAVIQIMRPSKKEAYMRASNDGIRIACLIKRLEDNEGRFMGEEFYPVAAHVQPFIADDIRLLNFQVGVTEFGKHFIDCQKLPSITGKSDSWAESKAKAVKQAKVGFIRCHANFDKKQYEVTSINLQKRPAVFVDLARALDAAIAANVVDHLKHPVIKELGIKVDTKRAEELARKANAVKKVNSQEIENFELSSTPTDDVTIDAELAELMPEDEVIYDESDLTGDQVSIEEAIA